MLLISACRLVMLYICAKFHEIIWYQNYRADAISILKIAKGNNSAKNVGGVTVVNLHVVWSFFIFLPSFMKLSRTVSKL